MNRNAVARKLTQLFAKSDVHRRGAHDAFDDAGRYIDDLHDRHRLPTEEQIRTGIPTGASGDGAFEMTDHYSDDSQHDNVSEEYERFSRLLDGLHEELKSIKAGQMVLASAFHSILKGDETDDGEDEDEPSAEELDKALEHVRAGGALPDGLEVQHKSVEEVLLHVMGRSKGSSTPPDLRVRKGVPLHMRIEKAIAEGQDVGRLSMGEAMEAGTLVNRLQATQRGELVKGIFGDSLRKASPNVRAIFAEEGVKPDKVEFVVGI